MKSNYVAISGNIGVGKTTLAENMIKIMCLQGHLESEMVINREDMENPFLPLFYDNMKDNCLKMQMWFLINRVSSYESMGNRFFIQDRLHDEEYEVFVKNMRDMGLMTEIEFKLYQTYFELIGSILPKPKVTIFLSAKPHTVAQRIEQRGREYEQDIEISYLKNLNKLYEEWASTHKDDKNFIYIDTDKVDLTNEIQLLSIYENYFKPNII